MSLRVVLAGAGGRMGRTLGPGLETQPDIHLVARTGRGDDLRAVLRSSRADVLVDFTTPDAAASQVRIALEEGVSPVSGTTGFRPGEIDALQSLASKRGIGGVIAPNFSTGAVLMIELARQAARHLPQVEIVEMHHDGKKDAPSGTAKLTAEKIALELGLEGRALPAPAARGDTSLGVAIHSVRLKGMIAHQEVLLSGLGQWLTIRHDVVGREAYLEGVLLAVRKVKHLDRLVYGLEKLLFEEGGP